MTVGKCEMLGLTNSPQKKQKAPYNPAGLQALQARVDMGMRF